MKFKYLCLIIFCMPDLTTSFVDVNIITSYLKAKSLNVGFFIGCLEKKENLKVFKYFNMGENRLKFFRSDHFKIKETHGHFAVILDADCKDSVGVLIKGGKDKLFGTFYHWLILTNKSNFSLNFNTVDLNIDSDVQVIRPKNNSKNYVIEDVYNPSYSRGGELKVRPIGYSDEINGYYKVKVNSCFFCSRRNMTGVTLKTKIVGPQDFQGSIKKYLDNLNTKGFNLFSVFMYHLLKNCHHYYNFKYTIATTNSSGYVQANNKFDGIVADIENKVIDYGTTPMLARIDRGEVVRFGRQTWPFKVVFIFRDMNPRYRSDVFFRPLSTGVWICTLCTSAVIIVFLRVTSRFERRRISEGIDYSWSVHAVVTLGAFCQQAPNIAATTIVYRNIILQCYNIARNVAAIFGAVGKSNGFASTYTNFSPQGISSATNLFSGKITHLFLLIVTLLLYQFYSASLVSSLLMKPPTRIKTLRDLVDSGMKAGCEDIFYTRAYFGYTSDQASQELYAKQIVARNFSTYMDVMTGLALVEKGNFAFHVEPVTAYPIIRTTFQENEICELGEVPMMGIKPTHMAYQKDSPFKDLFDTCVHRIAEYGIMSRDLKYWHPRKPECLHAGQASSVSVNLDHFYPVLYFLGFGMLVSLMLLVLENLYFHWEKIYMMMKMKLKVGH